MEKSTETVFININKRISLHAAFADGYCEREKGLVMSCILKENFIKTTRYIYKVEYDQKNSEDYEVITRVYYFRWDSGEEQFVRRYLDNSYFAKALYNQEFKCCAGKEISDRFCCTSIVLEVCIQIIIFSISVS